MEVNLTRKQFWIVSVLLGLVLFIISLTINMIGLYYNEEVKIGCTNGSIEIYNKSELNTLKSVCGGANVYKYNDNTGLGAYFPDKKRMNLAISEYENR